MDESDPERVKEALHRRVLEVVAVAAHRMPHPGRPEQPVVVSPAAHWPPWFKDRRLSRALTTLGRACKALFVLRHKHEERTRSAVQRQLYRGEARHSFVLKCGSIAAGPAGDPNASIPPPQPRVMAPMFADYGRNKPRSAVTFVSPAALDAGVGAAYGLERRLLAVENTRGLSKADMVHNALLPKIEVDPETYEVRADGKLLTCEPAEVVSMAQRHFLY